MDDKINYLNRLQKITYLKLIVLPLNLVLGWLKVLLEQPFVRSSASIDGRMDGKMINIFY